MNEPTLKRDIGYTLLTLYGLGTILGAGIYVLVGEVAGQAGMATPSAFLVASLLAGVTAFSYGELASRLPRSSGEAAYVAAAFRLPTAAIVIGWAVIASGVVSSATLTRGFVGYLELFVTLPPSLVICVLITVVTAFAVWGISESLLLAGAVTVVEVAGLVFVCIVAGDSLGTLPANWRLLLPQPETASVMGVLSGAFIAFYAFIGFEDMVNVAEEVKDPRRTMPRAIVTALVVSTLLYFVVATIAVLSLPSETLAESSAPLAILVESRGVSPRIIGLISLLAVINGALVQMIMASRVLYGLSSQNMAWAVFSRINATTRTPIHATVVVATCILLLALTLSLGRLARVTSFIALGVFAAVNAALLALKKLDAEQPEFTVPRLVPAAGLILCLSMMAYQVVELLAGSPD